MHKVILAVLLYALALTHLSCNANDENENDADSANREVVNLSHLDHLYVPVIFPNGTKAAGIYIYAEAPDYHHVADSDEGFTCVDDVARAAQVYMRSKAFATDTSLQKRASSLIRFLLEMQSSNGYFYNFLQLDGQINKIGKTSTNNANWWSWRALQTLTEAASMYGKFDVELTDKIHAAMAILLNKVASDWATLPVRTKNVAGLAVPDYFPAGSAADQTAILMLSLINYCSFNKDDVLPAYINTLAKGLLQMQHGSRAKFPYGCFLSWENVWHAYGNDQAYALFKAGRFLNDTTLIRSALQEVDNFYPWLLKQGMLSSFAIEKTNSNYSIKDRQLFAQIAYGLRPMIFASIEAYEFTGEQKYANLARQLTGWFLGKNVAGKILYDKHTGRCYDGILSATEINPNAGAESTIEALLALQLMEKHNLLDSIVKGEK